MHRNHPREQRFSGRAGGLLALLPLLAFPPLNTLSGDPPAKVPPIPPVVCRAAVPAPAIVDPYAISLAPTPNANGAAGDVTLTFAPSPFGVTVTEDGHHVYDLRLSTSGLSPAPGVAYVAWATTPSLDQTEKLGVLGADGTVQSQVRFNKFLVFVTAEPSADVETWSGPIALRGISRSGRMHTMAGHGPFEGEAC